MDKMNMMRYIVILVISLIITTAAGAQNTRLAKQYFDNGEYEKAAALYDELYQKNGNNDFYFDRYFDCLLALEKYEESEQVLKKQIRRNNGNTRLYVAYGVLLERLGRDEEAAEQFNEAIEQLPGDQYSVSRLGSAFIKQAKYDYAIAAYEKGAELLNDNRVFSYNLGDLYRRMGQTSLMVESYLNVVDDNPDRLNQIKVLFQRYLEEDAHLELQTQLYERIQSGNDKTVFTELLAWVFVQRKDYRNALRQVKALDRRLEENGMRVFELGRVAANAGAYDIAIQAFDYIVEEKGQVSTLYIDAKEQALRVRRYKLIEGYEYTTEELEVLENQYFEFLNEFGKNKATASIILELAELQAIYMNKLPEGIEELSTLITFPGINPKLQASGKIALADYYLMQGDIWESTLLYSQVDKSFKEDILGHEARFRNARLAYYNGDFQWAQAQFDVLKTSTSKLIANDALDISVFIIDNMGLDTTTQALQMYADAELLVFRNQFDAVYQKLDSLVALFPNHSLEDDVLYLKAQVFQKRRDYKSAAKLYEQIVTDFPEDIRADNALFALAELNEKFLNNKEKAKELYETLFIDYSNSTFAVQARKQFRKLRGDSI